MADSPIGNPPSEDELNLALCAIRYTIGRRSYIVSDGQRWARRYGAISPWVRGVLIRDIEEARDRDERSTSEWSYLGHASDKEGWLAVLAELRAMEPADARS